MTMPEMTGDKLTQEMAAIRPGIPIMMCIGINHRIDAQTSKRFGITALVNKPISIDGLAEVINRVLRDGSSLIRNRRY